MNITIFSIEKNEDMHIEALLGEYQTMIRKFASLTCVRLFDKTLANAQKIGREAAQKAYEVAYRPYMNDAYTIALDEHGAQVDSVAFSSFFEKSARIHFFIGGAYGFSEQFLTSVDAKVSFGKCTFAHKLVKLVLAEQVFRGLSIINHHPYHK